MLRQTAALESVCAGFQSQSAAVNYRELLLAAAAGEEQGIQEVANSLAHAKKLKRERERGRETKKRTVCIFSRVMSAPKLKNLDGHKDF